MWHWSRESLPLHDHAKPCIHYFLSGHYLESFESKVVIAGPGSLLMKAANEPHANMMGAEASLALRIELRNSTALPFVKTGYLASPSAKATFALEQLALELKSGLPNETLERSTAAALAAISATCAEDERSVEECAAHALLSSPSQHIRIDTLAKELRLHRSHLARRFQNRYGCGMREFALRHQAMVALEHAAFDGMNVGEAVIEAGFYDHSHGTRVLKKVLGRSPSEWLDMHERLITA